MSASNFFNTAQTSNAFYRSSVPSSAANSNQQTSQTSNAFYRSSVPSSAANSNQQTNNVFQTPAAPFNNLHQQTPLYNPMPTSGPNQMPSSSSPPGYQDNFNFYLTPQPATSTLYSPNAPTFPPYNSPVTSPYNSPVTSPYSSPTTNSYRTVNIPNVNIPSSHIDSINYEEIERAKFIAKCAEAARLKELERNFIIWELYKLNHDYMHNIRLNREQEVQHLKNLLNHVRAVAAHYGIPMDYDYIRNVLRVNIGVAINALENGFVFETLYARARSEQAFRAKERAQFENSDRMGGAAGGSGGGDDGDGGDGDDFITRINKILKTGNAEQIANFLKTELGWDIGKGVFERIPLSSLEGSYARDGVGVRFNSKANDIRFMKGNPNSRYTTQQQDYVKITSNGKVLGRDGKVILETINGLNSSYQPNAHIPLNEWEKWEEWNKK